MLSFYSRYCTQLSLWTYGDFKPDLLLAVHIWSNEVNPNLTPHVPYIFSEQIYTADKFFPKHFFLFTHKRQPIHVMYTISLKIFS